MNTFRTLFAGRRVLFGLWLVLAIWAVVATVRLSFFMFDPSLTSASMIPSDPMAVHHSCFSGYVAAADRLGEAGTNIYDPANYARHGADGERRIPLGHFEQDPYNYPPTFLLLPKALLFVTHSFATLRAMWFGLSTIALLGALGAAATWIGGRTGLVVAALAPALWGAFPNLVALQTGNVQLLVVALSFMAMIAFETKRPALGGAMLAFAIGTKLSPAVLLLFLLGQRRYRDALWTAAFGVIYCVALVALGGAGALHDFIAYQLPRLSSGQYDPFKELVSARLVNGSMFGLAYKLELAGIVHDPDRIAGVVGRLYSLVVLAVTVIVALKAPFHAPAQSPEARTRRAIVWMAVLNLAVLQAPFLPPYGSLGPVWMLTLWASLGQRFWKTSALFVLGWVAVTIAVTTPTPAGLVVSMMTPFASLGMNLAALWYVLWRGSPAGDAAPRLTIPCALERGEAS